MKGEKIEATTSSGSDNKFAAGRKSRLLEDANKDARLAQKAADEAEELERQLLLEFADSEDEGEDEDINNKANGAVKDDAEATATGGSDNNNDHIDDTLSVGAVGRDEEEKKFTQSDEEFASDDDINQASAETGDAKRVVGGSDVKSHHRRSSLIPAKLASKVPLPENIALTAAIIKFNLVSTMNEIGDPVDEDDNDERQHLQFDCYNLYDNFVKEETKLKQPVGDGIRIKNVGVAKLDTFPPDDFDEWAVRITRADIERAKMEEEKKKELERKRLEEKAKKKAEKAERKERRKAKKYRKLQREFKGRELEALANGEALDLEVMAIVNPKKAAKIMDRQRRMEEMHERRKMIEEQRKERERLEKEAAMKEANRIRREAIKKQAIEDEVDEIMEQDRKLRGGLKGIVSGFRWTPKPEPDVIRQQIVDREVALKQEAKEAKKRRHEAEKERAKKIREKEERRALRALQQLSESSSEESDGVNSDLTDEDEITSRKGRSRRRSSVSRK